MCSRVGTFNQQVLWKFVIADAAFFESRGGSGVVGRRNFSFDRN
jgi:hypothetical protein